MLFKFYKFLFCFEFVERPWFYFLPQGKLYSFFLDVFYWKKSFFFLIHYIAMINPKNIMFINALKNYLYSMLLSFLNHYLVLDLFWHSLASCGFYLVHWNFSRFWAFTHSILNSYLGSCFYFQKKFDLYIKLLNLFVKNVSVIKSPLSK